MAQSVFLKLMIGGNEVPGESSVTTLGRENTIECLSFRSALRAPRDPATGKRTHEPVKIRKRIDRTTPLFIQALCNHEPIDSAEFMFFRRRIDGGRSVEERFFTVRLEQATVAGVTHVSDDPVVSGAPDPPPLEEVTFAFQTIQWVDVGSGASFMDSVPIA